MSLFYNFFIIGFSLSPFYFFRSGLPQISDYFYLLSLFPFIFDYKKLLTIINFFPKEILYFLFYTIFCSIFWAIRLDDSKFLMAPLYYGFNFLVSSLFFYFSIKNPIKVFTDIRNILFFTNIIVIAFNIINPSLTIRQTATFNNPNQLAFYGLFLMTIIQYLNNFNLPTKLKDLFIYGSGMLFVAISLSYGAIITLPLFIFSALSKLRFKLINFIIAIFIILLPIFLFLSSADFKFNITSRINNLERKIINFADVRGYSRLERYPIYLIFGSGEGQYTRFTLDSDNKNEIHSTPISILFSYGIFGSFFIAVGLIIIFRPLIFQEILLFSPIFLFSLSHMTLRSTYLWILIGLVFLRRKLKSK